MKTRPPICGVSRNPLVPIRPSDMRPVAVGVPISSVAPEVAGDLLLLNVNGEWLPRECWDSKTRDFDVIVWHDLPQDRDALRSVLLIASLFVPQLFALQGIAAFVAVTAAQFAINAILPPASPQAIARPASTGQNFSTSVQGNEARLDQAIWKICGRREITPPFACGPYLEYLPREGAVDPELDRDQFFYALLAVGVGDHTIAATKIANTSISRFDDVVIAQYLAPGVAPSLVRANVTTAAEVSGQVLDSGLYVGGFSACSPGRTCQSIGVDVVATRGLGKTASLTVSWRVEFRPINEFGQVLGAWSLLASESRTAFTSTPQRWSNEYALGTPQRVEVRLVRTDPKDTAPTALHEIAWGGLRGYLAEPAPLNAHTAHYEIVLRASSQLSQGASRDVRLIAEAHVRSLDEDLNWVPAAHSRNPSWWMLDLATSSTWGINKPESRVDLQSFYELAQICETRQDRFDYVFDSSVNAWDAMQMIARTCRARVFRRNGVISVARDELVDLPVTAFTPRNCLPGMKINEVLRQRKSPDGVIVEYEDHRTGEWTPIECPLPGVVTEMQRPIRLRLPGIVGATHAQREGIYEAFDKLYRPRRVQFTTEMQGLLLAYMSPVDFLADVQGYGSSGDVASWDEGTLVMTLTEPPDWSAAPLFLTLIRDDGTRTVSVQVTPGPTANDVTLPSVPDFELVLDQGNRERPKYLIGAKDLLKVIAIEDGGETEEGAQLFTITGVIDDDRVHEADVHLLPGPGVIQDPVGNPDDADEVGADQFIVRLMGHTFYAEYLSGVGSNTLVAEFTLGNDGSFSWFRQDGGATLSGSFPSEWILSGEIEPSEAALFEVRFTKLSPETIPGDSVLTATLDAWLSLGTARVVNYAGPGTFSGNTVVLRVEIRDVATETIQESRDMVLTLNAPEVGGG